MLRVEERQCEWAAPEQKAVVLPLLAEMVRPPLAVALLRTFEAEQMPSQLDQVADPAGAP
jgi:hypothetical protein